MLPDFRQQSKALSNRTLHLHCHIELFIRATSKMKEHMLDRQNQARTAPYNRMEETSAVLRGSMNSGNSISSSALKTS